MTPEIEADRHRVLWVTGARTPVGRAICAAWARRENTTIIATERDGHPSGPGIIGMTCDTTSRKAIDAVIEEARRHGGLDILIHADETESDASTLDIDPDAWDRIFDVNVRGAFLCSQAASRAMSETGKGGNIILIGSLRTEKVGLDTTVYSTTQGAIHALGRSMALGLRARGIRVNMIAPDAHGEDLRAAGPGAGKSAAPGDICASVAHATLFMAAPESGAICGATLTVDNGRSASV